jgi:uronate dehydrogenase
MSTRSVWGLDTKNAADRPIGFSDKRIAITGGSGRVGTTLRQALAGKVASIKIVDIAEPGPLDSTQTWEKVDIADGEALRPAWRM